MTNRYFQLTIRFNTTGEPVLLIALKIYRSFLLHQDSVPNMPSSSISRPSISKRSVSALVGCAILVTLDLTVATEAAEKSSNSIVENFTLKDFRGKTHSLSDYDDKIVVVYFTGTECPLAKLYSGKMQRLSREYADKGVVVLGVCSNVQDSIAELSAHARDHGITFPLLKDLNNKVADQFGATRTPEVFVLDQDRNLATRDALTHSTRLDRALGFPLQQKNGPTWR